MRFNLADKFTHKSDNLIETCTFFRFPQIQIFYKMYPGDVSFFGCVTASHSEEKGDGRTGKFFFERDNSDGKIENMEAKIRRI